MTRVLYTRLLIFALSILFTAVGAARAQVLILPPATKGDYSQIHSVAVISAIGEKLTLSYGHFLGNSSNDMPIQDWNIDALVETRLRQYLSGRFTFKDILYDRAALAKIPNTPFSFSNSQYADFLKSIPAGQVDAYIIVRPDLDYHSPGVAGLGLVNANNLGRAMAPIVWANYEIDIVDARTLKTIAYSSSRLRLRDNTPPTFPGTAETSLMSDGDSKLTERQFNILHATVVSLVNLSLIETLRDLSLGVDLPAPGARTMVPIPPDRDPYKAYKNVAVVSALGDRLSLESLAPFFVRGEFVAPVPDWGMDGLVEQRIKAALAKRYKIVEPNVDRTAFAGAIMWDDNGKPAPNFPGLNPRPDIDLYVVAIRLSQMINGTKVAGVGVDRASSVESATITAYAHYALVILDAHTMKVVFANSGLQSPDRASIVPQTVLDLTSWPKSITAPTADEIATYHAPIMDILNNSIDETLLHSGILGVVPTINPPPPSASAQN